MLCGKQHAADAVLVQRGDEIGNWVLHDVDLPQHLHLGALLGCHAGQEGFDVRLRTGDEHTLTSFAGGHLPPDDVSLPGLAQQQCQSPQSHGEDDHRAALHRPLEEHDEEGDGHADDGQRLCQLANGAPRRLVVDVGVEATCLQHDGCEGSHHRRHPVKFVHGGDGHGIGEKHRNEICTQEVAEPQAERQQGAVEQFSELQIDFLLPAQHNGV